jgi:hypothetical protein
MDVGERTISRRRLALSLGTFGRSALQDLVRRERGGMAAVLREAVTQLTQTDERRRRLPRFLLKRPPAADPVELELRLDAATWTALDREAERQHVPLDLLVEHAAMCRLAAVSQ